jgi:fructose-bisphosphate aldolase, class I
VAGATLKPNIVNPGLQCRESYSVQEIVAVNIFVFGTDVSRCNKGSKLPVGRSVSPRLSRLSAINQSNTGPWNLSFSGSQALQLPWLDLCKGTGDLQLDAMSKLYVEELKIASAAAQR